MLRNYFAAAIRHLLRNRLHACISIFGLAFGITAALLTALILRSELTYEDFIEHPEQAHLVGIHMELPSRAPFWADTLSVSIASALKSHLSSIGSVARLMPESVSIRNGEQQAFERIYWADPDTFRVLPMPMIAGDAVAALHQANGVVITRELARKYFKRDAPVGATLQINGNPMTIGAVIETIPQHRSQLRSTLFASSLAAFSAIAQAERESANLPEDARPQTNVRTYVRLANGAGPAVLTKSLEKALGVVWPQMAPDTRVKLEALPIQNVHLQPWINPGVEGRLALILTTGVLILFVACVNFVNLATASATTRALEVGVRKTAGAGRGTLMVQFLGESFAYVIVGTILAVMFTELSLPHVNAFLETGAQLDFFSHPQLLGWMALGVVVLTLLAGAYPAFVLSSFPPANVLKGGFTHSKTAHVVRQVLVTSQFAVLAGLIASAVVVYQQREYATRGELRVATDQHYIITETACESAFAHALTTLSGVRGVACTSLGFLSNGSFMTLELKDRTQATVAIEPIDARAMPLYDVAPISGRLLDDSPASLRHAVINASAVRLFGFGTPERALGQTLPFGPPGDQRNRYEIIGVVRDFGIGMVGNQKLGPTVYVYQPANLRLLDVRLSGQQIPETLAAIEALWKRTMGEVAWRTFFVDDFIEDIYRTMLRQAGLFGVLAGVAVVLSCLGLIGLATAVTVRRTREIGVRKAMGAGERDIVKLLVWQFTRPVLVATLIACPISAYLIQRWLDGFAYHISLSVWPFAFASVLALCVALLTVASQCFSVARTAPVDALHYE